MFGLKMWWLNSKSVHAVAFILFILEAVSDTLVDNIVFVIAYPVYYHMPASVGAFPYISAYLFPTRRMYRFIIILYVPVVCLWKAGRRVMRYRRGRALPSRPRSSSLLLKGEESIECCWGAEDGFSLADLYSDDDEGGLEEVEVSEDQNGLDELVEFELNGDSLSSLSCLKSGDVTAEEIEGDVIISENEQMSYDDVAVGFEDEIHLQDLAASREDGSITSQLYSKHQLGQKMRRMQKHLMEQEENLQHLGEDSYYKQQKSSSENLPSCDAEEEVGISCSDRQKSIFRQKIRNRLKYIHLKEEQEQIDQRRNLHRIVVFCWYSTLIIYQLGWRAVTGAYREIGHCMRFLLLLPYMQNLLYHLNISWLWQWLGWWWRCCYISKILGCGYRVIRFMFERCMQKLSLCFDEKTDHPSSSTGTQVEHRFTSVINERKNQLINDDGSWFRFWLRPKLRGSMSWGELVHLNDDKYQDVLRQYNNRWTLYRKIPLKSISRFWGRLSNMELPVWLRRPGLSLYIWIYRCRLYEATIQDLTQYKSFSQFFRRVLKPGVRPICAQACLTSPADGTVLYCGPVRDGCLEQVKDVVYSLEGFLGPLDFFLPLLSRSASTMSNSLCSETPKFYVGEEDEGEGRVEGQNSKGLKSYTDDASVTVDEVTSNYAQSLLSNPSQNILHQCVVYLAPGDYHRFHSPADWNVLARRHFPGELFSVNPGVARWLQGLFNFNERAMYVGHWLHGFFSMTAVGATNVGSINVPFDKGLATNTATVWEDGSFNDCSFIKRRQRSRSQAPNTRSQAPGVPVKKGELFGDFNLGSTIVLLFEAPRDFEFSVKPGAKVKYGTALGQYNTAKRSSVSASKRRFSYKKW